MLAEAGLVQALGRDSPDVQDVVPDTRSSVLERRAPFHPPATTSTCASVTWLVL